MPFADDFCAVAGYPPFPWQEALYEAFASGDIPPACTLPTGLGKTNVIAVWLIALAHKKPVPRRLVYVVNRRTVVDQTTNEAEKLRGNAAEIGINNLAISTLRGQFADNRKWSADPSRPAIICGTVDMIGSRLLFSGYGVGYKGKPLQAGFLGQDVQLVHEEAHLEPAFQHLLDAIHREQERCNEFRPFRVMQLTATTRGEAGAKALSLQPEDLKHQIVKQRVEAAKSLQLHPARDDSKIADQISELALKHKDANVAVLVFVRTLEDVKKVCDRLTKKDGVPADQVGQLTGTMRGLERDRMANPRDPEGSRVFARFLRPPKPDASESERWKIDPQPGTVFLVCTSAGEVGVDISADHLVCDLSTFDSMAQRFGRVNRYGDCRDTRVDVDVVHPIKFDDKDSLAPAREGTLALLRALNGDASPLSIDGLDPEARRAAFAPPPTMLPATDILFDAWALTSIRKKMPGRPPVEPYLHGIAEWEPPVTQVAWRDEVEIIVGDLREQYPPADLLDEYPPLPHELLRDRSDRVFKQMEALASRCKDTSKDVPVWLITERQALETTTLAELIDKRRKDRINGCTILLPPGVGGLSPGGMLDGDSAHADDVADLPGRRIRLWSDDPRLNGPSGMALVATIDTDPNAADRDTTDDDAESEKVSIEHAEAGHASIRSGPFWHWFASPFDAENATRASIRPIKWKHHTDDVVHRTEAIVAGLELPDDLRNAIIVAAELHDLGKKRVLWQRSIGNPRPEDWHAKPGNPEHGPRWRPLHLSDYRHEFGSLLDAQSESRFKALSGEMQDLVLHLIAAHHGRARPLFTADEALDPAPPAGILPDDMATETPRRFARLQRKYGRWGLAWLESLLRAADWAASAEPSAVSDSISSGKVTT
ncbi:MAG: type I-U CRISPR-associated helicase/endonuclease Cas3 [Planctomycetota bacterium]